MKTIDELFGEVEMMMTRFNAKFHDPMSVDMGGMEQQVASLCDAVAELPKPDQVQYIGKLTTILESLNSLGTRLKEQLAEPAELPKLRSASVAYKTADSRDNFGKRDSDG